MKIYVKKINNTKTHLSILNVMKISVSFDTRGLTILTHKTLKKTKNGLIVLNRA